MTTSPSDQGGRTVTACESCRKAELRAVVIASAFVYLRCAACGYVFAIEDRRRVVRADYKGRIFSF